MKLCQRRLIVAFSSCALWPVDPSLSSLITQAGQVAYGALIVTFLGAVHWGIAMTSTLCKCRALALWKCGALALLLPLHQFSQLVLAHFLFPTLKCTLHRKGIVHIYATSICQVAGAAPPTHTHTLKHPSGLLCTLHHHPTPILELFFSFFLAPSPLG